MSKVWSPLLNDLDQLKHLHLIRPIPAIYVPQRTIARHASDHANWTLKRARVNFSLDYRGEYMVESEIRFRAEKLSFERSLTTA
jgi:hypothetical protein